MATPATSVSVTFRLKNETLLLYKNVTFFPKAQLLLFNGDNSSIDIDKENIEFISILEQRYIIKRIEPTDNGVPQIWLETT